MRTSTEPANVALTKTIAALNSFCVLCGSNTESSDNLAFSYIEKFRDNKTPVVNNGGPMPRYSLPKLKFFSDNFVLRTLPSKDSVGVVSAIEEVCVITFIVSNGCPNKVRTQPAENPERNETTLTLGSLLSIANDN